MIEALIDDLIATQFQIAMADVYTAIPCRITNIHGDFGEQRVDVQPVVNELYKDGTSEEQPQILSVPVLLPGSEQSLVSFPLAVGDTVMCIFSQRSMDNFKISTGGPTPPNDFRKHSDQDAVAIPGLRSFPRSVNKPSLRKFPHDPLRDLVVAHNIGSGTEVMIQLKQSGDVVINTDFNVIVNSKTVTLNATESMTVNTPTLNMNVGTTNWTGNIIHSGNYTMTGQARFNGRLFDTHTHSGVTPGTGTSGPVNGV
ncbi:hypothetical protein NoPa_00021 [Pseudomonas phage vB_PpuM-NoPa]|uniref:Phage protein Gp138 N-terminal domain-containing protein n=1 Tax=Pseudomonas phage vB_PpuM-NoPa TaxID=3132619 RepID=A0AAX4MY55_9CAUD